MKEIRFFYDADAPASTELPDDEAMHALRVLRLKSGDEFMLMDGRGTYYRAEVTLAATKKCMYRILETMPQEPQWLGKLNIAIGPTKMMDRIEWLVKTLSVGLSRLLVLRRLSYLQPNRVISHGNLLSPRCSR